jgi:hypothetical protein
MKLASRVFSSTSAAIQTPPFDDRITRQEQPDMGMCDL